MIVCDKIERRFSGSRGEVTALAGVSLTVEDGEFVAIRGPSGCGKSTLLLAMGGMQRPSSGRLLLGDQDLYALPAAQRNHVRAERIGFVFQLFHLIPFLTVRENIVAGLPPGRRVADSAAYVDELLDQLGLEQRSGERPGTLSAGERQRVALARALIKKPALILADEPTGNLDPDNAAEVFRHLATFQRAGGTVVVVTHGNDSAPHVTRSIHLADGRLVAPANGDDTVSGSAKSVQPVSSS